MTGPELATLSTLGWVVLTLAVLIVVGTWSTGESWSILPGLVRGVRDWATEQAVARQPSSPSPWAITAPAPEAVVASTFARDPRQPAELAQLAELAELADLGPAEIEELWIRPTSR